MYIHPLAITQIDWPSYILKTKEYLGRDPSKIVDSLRLKTDHISSFAYSLSNGINDTAFNHISASFIFILDKELLDVLNNKCTLNIYSISIDRYEYYCIVSGTMCQWLSTCTMVCIKDIEYDLRLSFNKIVEWFEKNNFKKFFNKEKVNLDDGTWIYN